MDDSEETVIKTCFRAHGPRIGWLENECVDLIPEAAIAEANVMASKAGSSKMPSKKSLGKMLASNQWIATQSKDRNTYKVRRGTVVQDVWRVHAFRLFEVALPWGTFDVESYKAMSEIERLNLYRCRREEATRRFREQLTRFQVDALLNPYLTESDRQKVTKLHSKQADAHGLEADDTPRYIPYPPKLDHFPATASQARMTSWLDFISPHLDSPGLCGKTEKYIRAQAQLLHHLGPAA